MPTHLYEQSNSLFVCIVTKLVGTYGQSVKYCPQLFEMLCLYPSKTWIYIREHMKGRPHRKSLYVFRQQGNLLRF